MSLHGQLIRACKEGDLKKVKRLHQLGVALTWNMNHPIRAAANKGHLSVVKYLHENGVNIHFQEDTPLCLAARGGHLSVVKYLHENGADLTTDGNYAICYAAKNGHLPVVKYLHEHGADVTNDFAIYWAAEKGHWPVVKYLWLHGGGERFVPLDKLQEWRLELEHKKKSDMYKLLLSKERALLSELRHDERKYPPLSALKDGMSALEMQSVLSAVDDAIKRARKRCEECREMLSYRPGGKGYEEAKESFVELKYKKDVEPLI